MTQLIDIAEGRLKRAIDASEKFEPQKISRKLTTTRKTNSEIGGSIILVVPSDLYDDADKMHQKTWRGEILNDGSLRFKPL